MIMSRRLSVGAKERDGEKRKKDIYSLIPSAVFSIGFCFWQDAFFLNLCMYVCLFVCLTSIYEFGKFY